MLDMGGVPEASSNRRIDVGRNNRVKAVALDFDLITRSIEAQKARADADASAAAAAAESPSTAGTASIPNSSTIRPDAGVVDKIAGLLNVQLGGETSRRREEEDDLSRLTGEMPGRTSSSSSLSSFGSATEEGEDVGGGEIGSSILGVLGKSRSTPGGGQRATTTPPRAAGATTSTKAPPFVDVRSKYADKLRRKFDGGLAGVERANAEREDALSKGDAAGHVAARRIAAHTAVPSGSKWLATTGAASLLQYLTNRSVRVALLPNPSNDGDEGRVCAEGGRMDDLVRQLPKVRFDALLKGEASDASAEAALSRCEGEMDVPSSETMVVSDREDYLRSAKEHGMFTCRVRPPNAPRGNVSTSYTVSSVSEVEEALNDMSGISYNTVFSSVGINHGGV